jgi:hypothetical protein
MTQQYDPKTNYVWTPEDTFEITGQQFGLLLNVVRSYMQSEEAAKFRSMVEASKVLESVLIQGVETGVIKAQEDVNETELKVSEMNVVE